MTIPQTLRINALDDSGDVVAARATALRLDRGRLDEQRHQYLDLDPDSACRPQGFVCPACLPKGVASDG
ncbi:hypothetical protein [Streptomyces phytophilus]|uniref:hypothetical protein n=1 Tax=Streptomyces phytophilus TaxID=722715 RepID=UPI0015F038C1|nr:hypothetical protein [Streptomyces phytophilus]